ncbi:MAG TPA: polysaccharide pyruvyl transferase family protein [Gemmatales bacterium]|nr:polysaccharide pyruvyl transferase family protein [Gemmatales bacterium]
MSTLVCWWGSFDQGGETLGDLWAVCAVINKLLSVDQKVILAGKTQYSEFPIPARSWKEVEPKAVSNLVFVCGPVVGSFAEFTSLVQKFSRSKKIAIGVSILPISSPKHWNPFDAVISRDGVIPSWGDIAPAFPSSWMQAAGKSTHGEYVGLCLRGQQSEYGKQACLADQANHLANALALKTKLPVQILDTKLNNDPNRTRQIIKEFERCRLIISTRMHGGVLALCSGIPALGIDQISGGAKLHSVLFGCGWPYVLRAEEAKSADLEKVIHDFMALPESLLRTISAARVNLVRKAEHALDMLPPLLTTQ